jgi:Domain of unknown function (DUF4389)
VSEDPAALRGDYFIVDSPYETARWRPLVNVVLAVPHLVIASALGRLANVGFLVYWLAFLFTGNLNPGLYGLMAMSERYNERAMGFLLAWSERYPPFDFTPGPADNGAYPPIRLNLPAPSERTPRSAALNVLKAIPHYVVMFIYAIGAVAVAVAAWFAVLFTGSWPRSMRVFLVRVTNYYFRVWTYVTMVESGYPKFGLA